MKRVINGKLYNTKTATLIADYEHLDRNDFGWYYEALYRTKKRAWFIAGEGNANSKYAESVAQNTRGPGEALYPIDDKAAQQWCEEHQVDPDIIKEFFDIEDA